jgi:hypothetical protein
MQNFGTSVIFDLEAFGNAAATAETFREIFFMTVQERFAAYCKCREAIKLVRPLLSPYLQQCAEEEILQQIQEDGAYFHIFKSFPPFSIFTRRFLVTSSNNGYSSASVLKSSLIGSSLPTELNSTFIFVCVPVAVGTCLPSRCLQKALHATILTLADSSVSLPRGNMTCPGS